MKRKHHFAYPPYRDNILHLFHAIQRENNLSRSITRDNIDDIASYLDISVAEVEGVLSFYRLFSGRKRGQHIIRLCDSLSCRITDSLKIYNHIKKRLGIRRNQTTPDGLFTLEIVNCLGNCDTAPNMMINDTLYTHLTSEKVDDILASCRNKEAVI
ncbi:MAG: NAD(P)H-dependent oxidoreductase subunit E [Spirochaetota bacterium]